MNRIVFIFLFIYAFNQHVWAQSKFYDLLVQDSLFLDVDDDSIADFKLSSNAVRDFFGWNRGIFFEIKGLGQNEASNYNLPFYAKIDTIQNFTNRSSLASYGQTGGTGNFLDSDSAFVGIRIYKSGNWKYGWLRISISKTSFRLISSHIYSESELPMVGEQMEARVSFLTIQSTGDNLKCSFKPFEFPDSVVNYKYLIATTQQVQTFTFDDYKQSPHFISLQSTDSLISFVSTLQYDAGGNLLSPGVWYQVVIIAEIPVAHFFATGYTISKTPARFYKDVQLTSFQFQQMYSGPSSYIHHFQASFQNYSECPLAKFSIVNDSNVTIFEQQFTIQQDSLNFSFSTDSLTFLNKPLSNYKNRVYFQWEFIPDNIQCDSSTSIKIDTSFSRYVSIPDSLQLIDSDLHKDQRDLLCRVYFNNLQGSTKAFLFVKETNHAIPSMDSLRAYPNRLFEVSIQNGLNEFEFSLNVPDVYGKNIKWYGDYQVGLWAIPDSVISDTSHIFLTNSIVFLRDTIRPDWVFQTGIVHPGWIHVILDSPEYCSASNPSQPDSLNIGLGASFDFKFFTSWNTSPSHSETYDSFRGINNTFIIAPLDTLCYHQGSYFYKSDRQCTGFALSEYRNWVYYNEPYEKDYYTGEYFPFVKVIGVDSIYGWIHFDGIRVYDWAYENKQFISIDVTVELNPDIWSSSEFLLTLFEVPEKLVVYDVLGKEIWKYSNHADQKVFDFKHLDPGFYFVQYQRKNKTIERIKFSK